MACGEYLQVRGVEESVCIFFGWRPLASFPSLADRQIASGVFFQTQSRVPAQAARKSKAFNPSFSMCSLLTARHAVVHLTSCSEASSEANHCEANIIIGQQCDPLNLPKSPWLLIVSNGFFRGFLFRTSHFSITQTPFPGHKF
jgi:hypothetical protein